ncbi:MAG: adenylate kinase [Nanoarchaeota archaeon]|nr:adenylate kinase [Nanoarchaeota archaeon]
MNVILLGPPGTGKGTQAELISEHYKIPHISTGDMFREIQKEDSELGKKVKDLIMGGKFVGDEITVEIVKKRINQKDCKNGFLLDGFPRTIPQAEALDKLTKIDHALLIRSSDDVIVKRLSSRRQCRKCNAIYGIDKKPENEGVCDKCGGELYQREDDKEEVIQKRLDTYREQTEPLIEYYTRKGIIAEVDGEQAIQKISESIQKILG